MPKPRSPGWWYPWTFVGGMLVVIAVNAVLISLAVGTFTGIETQDHYRKGLAYNRALEAERDQVERGWSMEVELSAERTGDGPRDAEVVVTFVDRYKRPLDDLIVHATLVRPTHDGHDVEAPLVHRGDGRYVAEMTVPLPGQWDARVHAHRGDEVFRENRRVYLPR